MGSSELANCMPPPLPRPRCTRLSTLSHPNAVQTPNARVNQYLHSFIPSSGKLWNSLPLSVFPPSYDLNSFKREVSRHLSNSSCFSALTFLLKGEAYSGRFFSLLCFCPWVCLL